ncbi:MAG TPA: hypothetical protein VIB08_04570 [Thermoanaerobaculia bacterium]
MFAANWEELSRRLAAVVAPHLAAGEELSGVVHAHQAKLFSAELWAIGVTPERLVMVPIDRRHEAAGAPLSIPRGELADCSVWGWGGGVAEFLSMTADQQIRFTAAGRKFKLMALGGNLLEDALSGPAQRQGLEALIRFLLTSRPTR